MPQSASDTVTIPPGTLSQEGEDREMAMDALKNLTSNIPDWQKRLDDVGSQIDRRQAELAAVAAADPKSAEARSLRNTGSTESLKPKNEGSPYPDEPAPQSSMEHDGQMKKPATPPRDLRRRQSVSPPGPNQSGTSSAVPGNAREAIGVAAHSRAAVAGRRRMRSGSLLSQDGAPPTYRTRSMIIVYYDSYVQGFFDDMVRFISSSRNLLRKAKMAAKVAQIKRMAELDIPDDDGSGDDKAEQQLPTLRYVSTRRMRTMGLSGSALGGSDQPPDVYDSLDKSLEVIQSTCEHGAHQFLRDADCHDEIEKIRKRLEEVLSMSRKEAERVEREEPELAKETPDVGRVRTRRPISVRRDISSSTKDDPIQVREDLKFNAPIEAASRGTPMLSTAALEADMKMDVDEGIDVEAELPKLHYRSTRHMGPQQLHRT